MAVNEFAPMNKLQVYPNPAVDNIEVTVTEEMRYEIINVAGQVLKSGRLSTAENAIKIDDLSKGFYLLNLTSKLLEVQTVKFLKQ